MGCSSQAGSGQLPGGSQPAKSTEPNPSPVLFQNHHVAVAESAVIGYPHKIKGEGKMLAFLPLKRLSQGYCTAVGSGTVTPTPGSNTVPTPYSMLAGISAQPSQPTHETSWALHKAAAAAPWPKALTAQATEHPLRLPAERDLSWH